MSENPKRSQSDEMDRQQAVLNANAAKPLSEGAAADLRRKIKDDETNGRTSWPKIGVRFSDGPEEKEDAVSEILRFMDDNSVQLPDADDIFRQKIPQLMEEGAASQRGFLTFTVATPSISTRYELYQISEALDERIIAVLTGLGFELKNKIGSRYVGKGLGNTAIQLISDVKSKKRLHIQLSIHKIEEIFHRNLGDDLQNEQAINKRKLDKGASQLNRNLEEHIRIIFNALNIPEDRYEDFKADLITSAERMKQASSQPALPRATDNIADFTAASTQSNDKPLCVPMGAPEKYLGKGKSGEIYAFLQSVYPYREGGELLSTAFLQEHDPVALKAFRNRQRTAPVPKNLQGLTDPSWGTREIGILEKFGVDLMTSEGEAEAKRLMSAIGNRIYRKNEI